MEENSVIVSCQLPASVLKRLDLYLAKVRLSLIKDTRNDDLRIPTRSSFLREALEKHLESVITV